MTGREGEEGYREEGDGEELACVEGGEADEKLPHFDGREGEELVLTGEAVRIGEVGVWERRGRALGRPFLDSGGLWFGPPWLGAGLGESKQLFAWHRHEQQVLLLTRLMRLNG